MAQVIDIFHTESGTDRALREAEMRAENWFDPALVAAFMSAQTDPDFWSMLKSPDLEARVFSMKPALQSGPVDEDYLDDIAAAFSDVVDAKSPFTADHSNRVTLYTDMIGIGRAHV